MQKSCSQLPHRCDKEHVQLLCKLMNFSFMGRFSWRRLWTNDYSVESQNETTAFLYMKGTAENILFERYLFFSTLC